MCLNTTTNPIKWEISNEEIPYFKAMKIMDNLTTKVINYESPEIVWLLSHPHVYTKGTSSLDNELINNNNIPVIPVNRGGKFTYHGPGQKIIYPILDLRKRGKDLKLYINKLELWIINTLGILGIPSYQKPEFIGVWVKKNHLEYKIAAIGVRVSKWVTSHGIALNVNPDLNYFKGIIPCGIKTYGVTSLKELNIDIDNKELNNLLKQTFQLIFGI